MSKTIEYPSEDDFNNDNSDVKWSAYNTLLIDKKDITKGYYYVGVYAYSLS